MKLFSINPYDSDPDAHLYSGTTTYLPTTAGVTVTDETPITLSAVLAATRLISQIVGMLPVRFQRRLANGGKEDDRAFRLNRLIRSEPNPYQDSMRFREMITSHAVLRGNGYSEIVPGPSGFMHSLIPLHPGRTEPEILDNGELTYVTKDRVGKPRRLKAEEVFHLAGWGDGLKGKSIIHAMRETIGNAVAVARHGSAYFGNNAQLGVLLRHPANLSTEAQERLLGQFERRHVGAVKAFRTLILEEGMDASQVGMSNEDSQFIESGKALVTEFARWIGVPPHMIGDLERATFDNIEQQSLEFVKYSILPWLKRWEFAIKRQLFLESEQASHTVEFNVDGLLRGDYKTRMEGHQIGIMMGIYSPDEIRAKFENENVRPDGLGGRYMMPSNMMPVVGAPQQLGPRSAVLVERATSVIQAGALRAVRKEVAQIEKRAKTLASDPKAWASSVDSFYSDHVSYLADVLGMKKGEAFEYCEAQKESLLTSGVGVIEHWGDEQVKVLTRAALGELGELEGNGDAK